MKVLLAVNWGEVGAYISGAIFLVGILSWWVAKLLDDKKKITEHEIKIEDLEDEVKEIKDRLKQARIM